MDSQDLLSLVALIISIIALIGAILQLLQQYFSSAEGFSNCGEQVMGPWSLYRARKFRWTELRFEVQFEAPVMFVCPPDNTRGPVPGQQLLFVKGTENSEIETRTPSYEAEKKMKSSQRPSKQAREYVHTADNERANWFILLQALHAMERNGMAWQQNKLKKERGFSGPKASMHLPEQVAPWEEHSVVVALQPKRKSWDTMPSEVRKPYATTTICHIVEMAAMLGLHWRDFDRSNHKYNAEGNGYLLTGRYIEELGIMFHFQIYAANKFESQRVIPNELIKLLAFGEVMTIYQPGPEDMAKADYDDDDPKSSGKLHFGSTTELVESLTYYGCNSKTTNYFRDENMTHGHLFPSESSVLPIHSMPQKLMPRLSVVFEVLGMVGQSVYLPNTYYRFIPNPTTFSWNRKNFSLRKLLLEYSRNMQEDNTIRPSYHILQLQDWSENLGHHLKHWSDRNDFSLALLRCLHQTIEKCDKYLTADDSMKKMVLLVVREHIQEVMKLLNEPVTPPPPKRDSTANAAADSEGDDSTLASSSPRAPTIEDLNSAAPEVRQAKLMHIYFHTIRPAVVKNCPLALKKRGMNPYVSSVASRSEFDLVLEGGGGGGSSGGSDNEDDDEEENENEKPAAAAVVVAVAPRVGTPQLVLPGGEEHAGFNASARLRRMPTEKEEELAEDVWCTLVLRMLCWLLLHDFHKKDVQISKSELYQSRLPVYVA